MTCLCVNPCLCLVSLSPSAFPPYNLVVFVKYTCSPLSQKLSFVLITHPCRSFFLLYYLFVFNNSFYMHTISHVLSRTPTMPFVSHTNRRSQTRLESQRQTKGRK